MASNSDVSVKFSADVSDLTKGVDQASADLTRFAKSVDDSQRPLDNFNNKTASTTASIGDYATKIGAALGKVTLGVGALAGAGVAAIEQVGRSAVAMLEPLRTAAGAFDQTLQSMSSVNAIAIRAGLSIEGLGQSFQNLQVKARAGDATTVQALSAIGLKASDVASLSQDALAVKMADAFSKARDSANKTAVGVALFGDAAGKLVPQLDQGSARIRELIAAADRAGTVIGPDLASKVQGTNSLFEQFGDRMRELSATTQGGLLKTFVQIKPAIDGMTQAFSDVVKNISSLIEYFNDLNGAGRKNAETSGLMASAARTFAAAIVNATVYVEEMAVRGVQRLAELGVSFDGLQKVATAFGNDLKAMASTSSNALYQAYAAAVAGVIDLFHDLAKAGSAALSFDFSGVSAAFGDMRTHVQEAADKIKSSLTPDLFTGTKRALDDMRAGGLAAAKSLDEIIDRLHKQRDAALALIAAGGKQGENTQTLDVGDPNVRVGDPSAAQKAIDGEIKVLRRGLEEKTAIWDASVALYGMSEDKRFELVQAETEKEYVAELALLQKRKGLAGQSAEAQQEAQNKIDELMVRHRTTMLQLDSQSIQSMAQKWQEGLSAITGAFNSQLRGLLAGTTSFHQAFKSMVGDLIITFIQACEQMGVKWLALQLGMTTASTTGASERAAAEAAGQGTSIASSVATALSKIQAGVASTIAGVTGATALTLGPAAPAAGAAAGAETEAAALAVLAPFEVGAYEIPRITPALLHRGEMVLPASFASGLRSAISGGSTGAGVDTHNHFHFPGVMDTNGFMQAIRNNSSPIARMLSKAMTQNPSLRPAY